MKKAVFLFLVIPVFGILLALGGQHASAQSSGEPGSPPPVNQIIIKYQDDAHLNAPAQARAASQMQRLSAAAGIELTYFRPMSGDAHVLRLPAQMSVPEAAKIAQELAALPEVEYAEPDLVLLPLGEQINTPQTAPNDPQYTNQWHYLVPGGNHYGVDAPSAWDITTGSGSVYVAVLDTGITDHADLSGRWTGGYDMISSSVVGNDGDGRDNDPHDPGDWVVAGECYAGSPAHNSSWHGTHVAGTIAAATNNNLGVAGLNWVSQVIPVRVLGKCGGSTSDIADAIRWAAGLSVTGVPNNPHPAQVINMSLGGGGSCGTTMQNAISAAYNAGTTVAVAAGNNNSDAGNFTPGNCNNVITIAATDRNGDRAYYSNYGSVVEIAAPGGDTRYSGSGVLSTLNAGTQGPAGDTYAYYQGTSMATPHVAGIVSLMYSVKPSITPAEVLSTLQNTVTAFPSGSTCSTSICGSGIANAGAAVAMANSGVAAPILNPISNSDGDGSYTVTWSAVTAPAAGSPAQSTHSLAAATYKIYLPLVMNQRTSYTLQEDDNSTFSSPTVVYNGGNTSWTATGKAPGTYYYRVRATTGRGTSGWSNIQSVTVGNGSGPASGFWNGNSEEFYVTSDGANVDDFAIYISVNGCGNYKITSSTVNPITNNSFADTDGTFVYSGTFNSSTTASGDEELINFNIDGCGLVSGGPWNWTANWVHSLQPAFHQATRVAADVVEADSSGRDGYKVIKITPAP